MTDQEIVQEMRNRLKFHEGEVERYRKALAVFIGPPQTNGTRPKREGEQRHPPTGGKRGVTRSRVVNYRSGHPTATALEIAKGLGLTEAAVSYHLTQIRKAAR